MTTTFGGQPFLDAWQQANDASRLRVARLALGQEWIGIKTPQMEQAARNILANDPRRWRHDGAGRLQATSADLREQAF